VHYPLPPSGVLNYDGLSSPPLPQTPRWGRFFGATRGFKTGHFHAEVNGGNGSQTYIRIVPGRPRHSPKTASAHPHPALRPFLCHPEYASKGVQWANEAARPRDLTNTLMGILEA
jgi:hypothetical protein